MGVDVPVMSEAEVREWIVRNVPVRDFQGKKVLLIVPDATRTAPLPLLFDALFHHLRPSVLQWDVMIALGTHPPMSDVQINHLLGVDDRERQRLFYQTRYFNHEWDRPDRLATLGVLTKDETAEISNGLLSLDVPVQINARILDYDALLVLGPVFPHEVVGFSGGNKYFFPGIAGPEILNFFHWLGALITNASIIGVKETPVRKVVDVAAKMIPVPRRAVTFVVSSTGGLHGLAYGTPEEAWSRSADLSSRVHIRRYAKPFRQVLSCCPPMYDELWTAGKCMYKLEPVVADGGELIIYAPHLSEISVTHGEYIRQIGYHVRDYFTKQWDKFRHLPWGVLAHSTHVRGGGTYENGVERPRIKVTLASKIPREECERINLGYRDPDSIDVESFANREDEGILLVRKAGEYLYRLDDSAPAAAPTSVAPSIPRATPDDPAGVSSRLQFALSVAAEASELILGYYQRSDLVVESKRDASPVTEADRGAEQLIRRRLAQAFPEDAILGEEFGEQAGTSGYRWILDPVDGTKAFIHGVPLFGTLIGVEYRGECVLGVCRLPALQEVVYAAIGQGAWWQIGSASPRPARVSAIRDLNVATFCTTDLNGWQAEGQAAAYERCLRSVGLARGWGDCYGHVLVATGRAEIMVDPRLNPWDAAALVPILHEAGGHFIDWTGTTTIHGGNGISVNAALKEAVLALINGRA